MGPWEKERAATNKIIFILKLFKAKKPSKVIFFHECKELEKHKFQNVDRVSAKNVSIKTFILKAV